MGRLKKFFQDIPRGIWLALLLLLAAALYDVWYRYQAPAASAQVGVIAPDGMSSSNPALSVWIDAAHEEGLLTEAVPVSNLISPSIWGSANGAHQNAMNNYRVLLLPDQILRQASVKLLKPLQDFVQHGGHVLVCFDAMTRPAAGDISSGRALLSDMVGIDYALFDSMGLNATSHGPVLGSDEDMTKLQIPPGKATPWPPSKTGQLAMTTYQYGFVSYPHYITKGSYSGHAWLTSPDGSLVLGEKTLGQGSVMFANLPLGDLKGRTDGLLLHAALKRIAEVAGIPTLAPTPDGIGGLVFNWHIDANSSLPALAEFDRRGFFSQGPFSIHITAGPDAHVKGDRAGMDLEHNPAMQQWVRRFVKRGDALGNHGGWIHDYFGQHVADGDRAEMKSLLIRNDEVVSKVAGRQIKEYSAPLGNQPQWVTQWIEDRGVLGYYFTGNTGMAPTRSYRDGELGAHKIWSFPILNLNQIASFEEALDNDMSPQYLSQWLVSIAEFSANTGTVRTFYSHPTGWPKYYDAIQIWFDRTKELAAEGRFRWYTMERIATFLNRREQVEWQEQDAGTQAHFSAAHKDSLNEMTWHLPKSRFARPIVVRGNAQVHETETAWTVIAGDGKTVAFDATINVSQP